jgi:hypothetical protein
MAGRSHHRKAEQVTQIAFDSLAFAAIGQGRVDWPSDASWDVFQELLSMSTLYEFAGGEGALHRLEETFYASVLVRRHRWSIGAMTQALSQMAANKSQERMPSPSRRALRR